MNGMDATEHLIIHVMRRSCGDRGDRGDGGDRGDRGSASIKFPNNYKS